jgi:hypothetical protein
MTSKIFDLITIDSCKIKLNASRNYKIQGHSCVPYEELIVTNPNYPDNVFLVHKNMIFEKSLCDSSYDVYKYDLEGNMISKDDYGKEFFRDMKVIMKL